MEEALRKLNSAMLTRRRLLGIGAGLGAAYLGNLSAGMHSPEIEAEAASAATNLTFMAAPYGAKLVRANLDRFEQQYPDIKVEYITEPGITYIQKMTTLLSTATRSFDLLQVGDEPFGGWAEAGWLEPLDGRPEIAGYKRDLYPFNVEAMTYKGKLYGLPYYSDFEIFAYNNKLLSGAGVSAPPSTWDEVKTQALALKKSANMNYPMITAMKKSFPNSFGLYWSMVYGAGGRFFDRDLNPVYPDKDPVALEALSWIVDAVNTWKILDPSSVETNNVQVAEALAAGQVAFGNIAKYDLKRLNDASLSKIAGDAKMARFPTLAKGQRGGSYGWARMYSITAMSKQKDQAWKLLQYVGGKDREGMYHTAKSWYLSDGLGFGYPQLAKDPDIIESTKKWGDITLISQQAALAKTRENIKAPWFAEWDVYHQEQIQEALLKKVSPKDALRASAKKAIELKKQ
jgi:multiple sugar transport system substrate-binding protein